MIQTALAERLRVVFAGPRNAGKSSLMNALFGKEVALVSDVPGTTTDPVTRAFEIPGLGPASITDTPGIDDVGELGMQRVRLARSRSAEADVRVLVTPGHLPPGKAEGELFSEWFASAVKPAILVFTYADKPADPAKEEWAAIAGAVRTEAPAGRGVDSLIAALSACRPEREPTPLEGIVKEGDLVLLVTPIDLAAPAGRLIMPQVQTIRDALDRDAAALMVKERELRTILKSLGRKPDLVVTDSQAFSKVAADIPEDVPLTSFSILFARKKGDLARFLEGLSAAAKSPRAPKVMVLESCAHHRQADDIGTVKIPRLFRQLVRDDAEFSFRRGMPDKEELQGFDLVIHCGACQLTRGKMAVRLERLEDAGVPVTNYGLFLAWVNGLMPRALEPFEDAMHAWDAIAHSKRKRYY